MDIKAKPIDGKEEYVFHSTEKIWRVLSSMA